MLLQSDFNELQLILMSKFDKLFHNVAPTRRGKRTKYLYGLFKNEVYSNDAHIHGIASYVLSSHHFTYTMTGSKIIKWECLISFFNVP